jgi:predicted Zn-dependent protease
MDYKLITYSILFLSLFFVGMFFDRIFPVEDESTEIEYEYVSEADQGYVRDKSIVNVIYYDGLPSKKIQLSIQLFLTEQMGFGEVLEVYGADDMRHRLIWDEEFDCYRYNSKDVLLDMLIAYNTKHLTIGIFMEEGFENFKVGLSGMDAIAGMNYFNGIILWANSEHIRVDEFFMNFQHEIFHSYQLDHCYGSNCIMGTHSGKGMCKWHRFEYENVRKEFYNGEQNY